ncbi:zinc finger protein interacting with ribonucleoprotein K-like [Dermacentor silvarum]|uniref:zinc finger protein interacting with ribonucleoprotein K-like n=1 Tax=Dermacentor silvarum TaxID=543639 RepID=UPI001899740B|nr:zinc finger protein interacting with ribonucleoprotein K-like [Dermacentor silvarum]
MSQVQMARAAAVAVASCPDARDCPMCDYVATARSSLIIHMRKHTGERPYRCHLCPAAFAKSSDRSRHFRTHQLHKPFNCGSCGKSFAQRVTLLSHRCHLTGSTGFKGQCHKCLRMFANAALLKEHTRECGSVANRAFFRLATG